MKSPSTPAFMKCFRRSENSFLPIKNFIRKICTRRWLRQYAYNYTKKKRFLFRNMLKYNNKLVGTSVSTVIRLKSDQQDCPTGKYS